MIIDISNKRPWHRELFDIGDGKTAAEQTNMCSYVWHIIKGFLFCLLMVGVGVAVGILLIEPIMSSLLWAIGDHSFMPFFSYGEYILVIELTILVIFTFISLCVLVGVIIGWMIDQVPSKKPTKKPIPTPGPGFIQTAYQGYKDKFCPIITFKKEET